MACIQYWETSLVSIGELTVAACWGNWDLYPQLNFIYQFYIIAYALDKISIIS